eukprot:3344697-Alexandrium_andersonii.AAC.1
MADQGPPREGPWRLVRAAHLPEDPWGADGRDHPSFARSHVRRHARMHAHTHIHPHAHAHAHAHAHERSKTIVRWRRR